MTQKQICETCGNVITGKAYPVENEPGLYECVKCYSSHIENDPDDEENEDDE